MRAEAEANAKAAELPRHPLPHPQAHPGILAPCPPFPFLPGRRGCLPGSMPRDGQEGQEGDQGATKPVEDTGYREEPGHLEDQMHNVTRTAMFLGKEMSQMWPLGPSTGFLIRAEGDVVQVPRVRPLPKAPSVPEP